jgi:hypothetical protein
MPPITSGLQCLGNADYGIVEDYIEGRQLELS